MSRHSLIVWMAFADFFLAISLIAFAGNARWARAAADAREESKRAEQNAERAKDFLEIDDKTRQLIVRLSDALSARGVQYQVDSKRVAIGLPEIALFESGSAVVRDLLTVGKVADALLETGHHWQQEFVLIIQGHTDATPVIGANSFATNLELSRLRARSVEEALSVHGIAAPGFQVVSQGLGEFEPRVDNCVSGLNEPPSLRFVCPGGSFRNEKALRPNRRIELRFGLFSGNTFTSIRSNR